MASGLRGIGHIPYERDAYWEQCASYLGYECVTKKEIYDKLGYIPLPTIEKMHKSRATHRLVAGGNRSGKTYGGCWEIIPYLFWLNTYGWVVSATYDLAEEMRRKIEDVLIERAGMTRATRNTDMASWEYTYSIKTHEFYLGNGSRFSVKSADAPDSMHAVSLDWILLDEAALLPYILYDTRLVPRLVDTGGWILSIGTFEWMTGEWFEEYFDIGQVPNEMGIESWNHPTEDNYHTYFALGGETPEMLGEKYRTNWQKIVDTNPEVEWPLKPGTQVIVWNIDISWLKDQKSRMKPEIYASRFEAQRATSPYLVFPDWSIKEHVSAERARFDPDLPVYLAIDPGGTYAVAAVQFKRFDDVGKDNELTKGLSLCVIDELYFQKTTTTSEVFQAAQQREWWGNVARWPWPHWDSRQGAIDVTAKEQQRTWEHLARQDETLQGLHLMARKVNREPGIQTLQYYLQTHSIFVHPRCTFWNLEMRRWTYPMPALAGVSMEDPRKAEPKDAWNHLTKAVIYLAVNLFGYYGHSETSAKINRREIIKRRREEHTQLRSAVVSQFRK